MDKRDIKAIGYEVWKALDIIGETVENLKVMDQRLRDCMEILEFDMNSIDLSKLKS